MHLFPSTPIPLGELGVARLKGVVRASTGCVGRFTLSAGADATGFSERVSFLTRRLGRLYAPLPGMWASFVAPEVEASIELRIGIDGQYGQSLARAHRALQTGSPSLVAPLTIRALSLGYLACVI